MIDKDKVQAQRLRDKMIYFEVLIIHLSLKLKHRISCHVCFTDRYIHVDLNQSVVLSNHFILFLMITSQIGYNNVISPVCTHSWIKSEVAGKMYSIFHSSHGLEESFLCEGNRTDNRGRPIVKTHHNLLFLDIS